VGKRRIDLSGTRVAANVLATVTGATAASRFGVAGTLVGTVVMSVASSAGTTVYQYYLNRGQDKVRHINPAIAPRTRVLHGGPAETWPAAGPGADSPGADSPGADSPGADSPGAGERAGDGAAPATPPQGASPAATGGFPIVSGGFPAVPASHGASGGKRFHWRQIPWNEVRWKRVAVMAGVTLVLAIVVISVIELAAGRPLGAIVRGQHTSGTSIGDVFGTQHSPGQQQSPSGPGSSAPAKAPAQHANTTGPAPTGSHPAVPVPSPVPSAPASSPAGRGIGGTGSGSTGSGGTGGGNTGGGNTGSGGQRP
jgi:uncharacterized membrane protein YgcG